MSHDPYQPETVNESRKAREQAYRDELADLKWLMGNRRGRRIVWRHLERTGVFRLSFNTNSMTMAFAEGNRNDGLRTLNLIHLACPELYLTMMQEANHGHDDNHRSHDHNDP